MKDALQTQCPARRRQLRQIALDRHMVMLRDLHDSAEDRTGRLEELTEGMASNEELPVERYMRQHDTGSMPVSFATYLRMHGQRTLRDASSDAIAGLCRVRDIVAIRGAMQDIVKQREQRIQFHKPNISHAAQARGGPSA